MTDPECTVLERNYISPPVQRGEFDWKMSIRPNQGWIISFKSPIRIPSNSSTSLA
jgi:hypothetical protein